MLLATTTAGCNLEKLGSSPAVTAFSTVKQSTFGCFHPEAAGVLPQDVAVIDLKSSDLTLGQRRRRRETADTPQVEVDLVPSSGKTSSNLSFRDGLARSSRSKFCHKSFSRQSMVSDLFGYGTRYSTYMNKENVSAPVPCLV